MLASEGGYYHGIVLTILIVLLDLDKRPFSIAMAIAISIVMEVALGWGIALATRLHTSLWLLLSITSLKELWQHYMDYN
jgi:hypothetical protein